MNMKLAACVLDVHANEWRVLKVLALILPMVVLAWKASTRLHGQYQQLPQNAGGN